MKGERAALMRLKARIFVNTVRAVRSEPLIKKAVVTFFVALWICGGFYGMYEGVRFLMSFPGVGDYLATRLFSLFIAGVSLMLVFSAMVLAYPILYSRGENALLHSLPLTQGAIMSCKLWETIFLSSWAYLLMAVPLLLAYFIAGGLGIRMFLLSWLFFLPLVVVCGAAGTLGVLILGRFLPRAGKWRSWGLLAVLGIWGVCILWKTGGGNRAGADQALQFLNVIMARCEVASWFLLPSSWVADGIRSADGGRYGEALFLWLVLVSNAIFLLSLSELLGERLLPAALDRYNSRGQFSGARSLRPRIARNSPLLALASKDLLTFIRDASQWGQFALFFGLLGIYFLNLRNVPYDMGSLFWRYLLFFLNLSALGLILAGLSSRFFFPLMSGELKRFWFLGLTRFGAGELLWEKYLLCALFTVGVSGLLALLSGIMLRVSPLLLAGSILSVVFMGIAISGLSIGLGAIYPNLKASAPVEVISGFGGTMVLVANVAYVFLALLIQAIPLFLHVRGLVRDDRFPLYFLGGLCVLGVVSCAAALLCLCTAKRKLETMEL
ncbi:MAG: hypothetical protein NTZ78_07625 [Candidatus Aureabacteria bacterium]|nr:hypothetical protein [Candidatus Auribacterota bacterium]